MADAGIDIEREVDELRAAIMRHANTLGAAKRSKLADRLRLDIRAFAQRVARSAVTQVPDRRNRAEVKVAVYQLLVPLIESQMSATARTLQAYRKFVGALGCVALVLALALGLALSWNSLAG